MQKIGALLWGTWISWRIQRRLEGAGFLHGDDGLVDDYSGRKSKDDINIRPDAPLMPPKWTWLGIHFWLIHLYRHRPLSI